MDSDTLPLSVSREVLQEHGALKVIKKKVVRKTLDMLKQLADSENESGEGSAWSMLVSPNPSTPPPFPNCLSFPI